MGVDGAGARPVAVAFCPHPPLLLPALEGQPDPETERLRDACSTAVASILSTNPDIVLVVGDGAPGIAYAAGDGGDLRPYGGSGGQSFSGPAATEGGELPLPYMVAAWLLDQAAFVGIRYGVAADDLGAALAGLNGRVAVLALGDGSARRTEKAPGHLDPAAGTFDAHVSGALAEGDAATLAAVDPEEGARLLAAGTVTWRAVGRAMTGTAVSSSLLYDRAPFGVGYMVARWIVDDLADVTHDPTGSGQASGGAPGT